MLGVCAIAVLANAAEVRLDGRRWPLLTPTEQPVPPGPPAPIVLPGQAVLDTTADHWVVELASPIVAPTPGLLLTPVAGRHDTIDRVTVDGDEVPVTLVGDVWVAALDVGPRAMLRVRRFLPERATSLVLPGGAELTVRGAAFVDGAPRVDGDTWWVPGPTVSLRPAAPPRPASGELVLGEVAVGLTVRDASVRARSRLRFRVARGVVQTVAFELSPRPADLDVVSEQASRIDATGATVTLTLDRPEQRLVEVEATWSRELPAGADARVEVALPSLRGTFRDTTVLQVARDTDREVLPDPGGLTTVLGASLPPWGRGLVDGAPTASYLGDETPEATLTLLKTSIVEQPPTVVEAAESTVATSAEGGLLVRSRLAVRNDRSAFLAVTVPEGSRLASARVKGRTALVTPLGGGRFLVPLARSVQSVRGSLSFPVELAFLGRTAPWSDSGPVTVPLPAYDAPVAVHRTTLHLPPGRRPRRRQVGRIVGAFTEGSGINYGFEDGDLRVGQAEALLDRAVTAWLDNRFEVSQQYVDQLDAIGADNADVARLRSNLEVVREPDATIEESGEVAKTRRLKSLARARAGKDLVVQREKIDEAERYLAKGDYDNAQRSYESALVIGERLERIAAEEDVSQQVQNQELRAQINVVAGVQPGAGAGPVDASSFDDLSGGDDAPSSGAVEPALPQLDVVATTASVIVPEQGVVVRHQRLLVPAGAPQSVTVRTRKSRRSP